MTHASHLDQQTGGDYDARVVSTGGGGGEGQKTLQKRVVLGISGGGEGLDRARKGVGEEIEVLSCVQDKPED